MSTALLVSLLVGGIVLLVLVVLGLAALKPDTFRVERSAVIAAPADRLFGYFDDFRKWPEWSPWEKLDPAMQRTLSGAVAGPGAVYEWSGNSKVGQGRMEILESSAPARLVIQLDFLKPFPGRNTTEFTFIPQGGTTVVRWLMHGPATGPFRIMSVFLNMDRMIGKDFEKGLANLKSVVEGRPSA